MSKIILFMWERTETEDFELFCVILWFLWRSRNEVVHGKEPTPMGSLGEIATMWLEEFLAANLERTLAGPGQQGEAPRWESPATNELKMNTDAAIFPNGAGTGIGVVIRNHEGKVVGAMEKRFKAVYDPLVAECIAIREGLCLLL